MALISYGAEYGPQAASWTTRGPTGGNAAATTPRVPPPSFNQSFVKPNVQDVGSDISQYYTAALAKDPRLASVMANISGQVPDDVRRQISQAAAERGIATGAPGSDNSNTALLRALGLTSLDLTNKGVDQYGQMYSQAPQFDPSELYVSPESQVKNQISTYLAQQEQDAAMERLRTQEAGATGRTAMGEAGATNRTGISQAGETGRLGMQIGNANAVREGAQGATARMVDAVLNQAYGGWGGQNQGGWNGNGDIFSYLQNFDPNRSSGTGSINKSTQSGTGLIYSGSAEGYDPAADIEDWYYNVSGGVDPNDNNGWPTS